MFDQGTRVRWLSTGKTGICTGWWKDHGENVVYYAADLGGGDTETFRPWEVEVISGPDVELKWSTSICQTYRASVPAMLVRRALADSHIEVPADVSTWTDTDFDMVTGEAVGALAELLEGYEKPDARVGEPDFESCWVDEAKILEALVQASGGGEVG